MAGLASSRQRITRQENARGSAPGIETVTIVAAEHSTLALLMSRARYAAAPPVGYIGGRSEHVTASSCGQDLDQCFRITTDPVEPPV